MSIQEIILKIKRGSLQSKNLVRGLFFPKKGSFLAVFFEISIIILVAISSFLLGRLSAISRNIASPDHDIEIIYPPLVPIDIPRYQASTTQSTLSSQTAKGAFVASKTGKVYYPIDCKSSNRIHEENRVFFSTEKEAQISGYTRSKMCP